MLTLFDFNNLYYSSFYITGFLSLLGSDFRLSYKFPDFLKGETYLSHRSKLLGVLLLFDDVQDVWIVIDTRDGCREQSYHIPLLEKVDFYFKVNFNEDEILKSQVLSTYKSKISPLAPFFPILPNNHKGLKPKLLPEKHVGWTAQEVLKRYKALKNIMTLSQILKLRNEDKTKDIFFVMTFYDNEKHSDDIDLRYKLMTLLKHDSEIDSSVGFISKGKLPSKYNELYISKFSFQDYMKNLASSRLGIYVRGLHQCLSFKMSEQLALGLPVCGQTFSNSKEVLKCLPKFLDQYQYETAEDIYCGIKTLLGDTEKMTILRQNNMDVFDKSLNPKAVCETILEKVGG